MTTNTHILLAIHFASNFQFCSIIIFGLNLKSSIRAKLSIESSGGDAGFKLHKPYEKICNDYDHGGYRRVGVKQIMLYLKINYELLFSGSDKCYNASFVVGAPSPGCFKDLLPTLQITTWSFSMLCPQSHSSDNHS